MWTDVTAAELHLSSAECAAKKGGVLWRPAPTWLPLHAVCPAQHTRWLPPLGSTNGTLINAINSCRAAAAAKASAQSGRSDWRQTLYIQLLATSRAQPQALPGQAAVLGEKVVGNPMPGVQGVEPHTLRYRVQRPQPPAWRWKARSRLLDQLNTRRPPQAVTSTTMGELCYRMNGSGFSGWDVQALSRA